MRKSISCPLWVCNFKFAFRVSCCLQIKNENCLKIKNFKTHQMSVPNKLCQRILKGQYLRVICFGFVFDKTFGKESSSLSWLHRFRKATFSNHFPSTRKAKPSFLKLLLLEERFEKNVVFVSVSSER